MQKREQRKPMVAGNWKMNASREAAQALITAIQQGATAFTAIDIAIFPSFVHLPLAEHLLKNTAIAWGAQNMYLGTAGAFTGEVSGAMLVDYGCQYVLIGHSERRALFHEDLTMVAAKLKAALEAKLKPILCLGETLAEREANQTENVIGMQLQSAIDAVGIHAFNQIVVAYEPVWAIGTGLTATPEQAQSVHAFIRKIFAQHDVVVANSMRILYGGSVKADNATGLFGMADIDGALVGGASLDAKSFLAICQAAEQTEIAME
ncbi:MAG: triose-phosphate isomerase [Gammaproteobacteria bacterium]|nr:triose-phosphate isomerase [Gammaproteobacteria bacterium]